MTTTTTRRDQGFRSQADALRAARTAIWGDVPFARREHVGPRTHPEVAYFDHRGCPVIVVTANVNGHLVLIDFDGFGRGTARRVS